MAYFGKKNFLVPTVHIFLHTQQKNLFAFCCQILYVSRDRSMHVSSMPGRGSYFKQNIKLPDRHYHYIRRR